MNSFLIALLVGAAPLAPAAARPIAPVAAPVADSDVQKLVALMAPADSLGRIAGRAFDVGMDQEIASDPKTRAVYDANPGLREQVGGKLRAQFTSILIAELPGLHTQLVQILKAELTPAEIADVLTFFSSPAGQKVRAEVYDTMGAAPGQSSQEIQQAAIASVMSKMTADDYPALMAFGASTAAQKMGTVNPKISAASQAWAEKLVATNRPKMETLAAKLAAEYLAKKGGK